VVSLALRCLCNSVNCFRIAYFNNQALHGLLNIDSLSLAHCLAHETQVPVNGTSSRLVTSSTNGFAPPSAFAWNRSRSRRSIHNQTIPSRATQCPEYFSWFFIQPSERLCRSFNLCLGAVFLSVRCFSSASSHRRMLSCSGAESVLEFIQIHNSYSLELIRRPS
jgi:hypothetical protein